MKSLWTEVVNGRGARQWAQARREWLRAGTMGKRENVSLSDICSRRSFGGELCFVVCYFRNFGTESLCGVFILLLHFVLDSQLASVVVVFGGHWHGSTRRECVECAVST